MKIFFLFLTIPILEIVLFIKISEIIGLTWTVSLIFFTALAGSITVRNQGLGVLFSLKNSPSNSLMLISNGVLILIAGILLVTPGFLTDTIGFLLLLPRFRGFVIESIKRKVTSSKKDTDFYQF